MKKKQKTETMTTRVCAAMYNDKPVIVSGCVDTQDNTSWIYRKDATDEVLVAARDYLMRTKEEGKNIGGVEWQTKDGKTVVLCVIVQGDTNANN